LRCRFFSVLCLAVSSTVALGQELAVTRQPLEGTARLQELQALVADVERKYGDRNLALARSLEALADQAASLAGVQALDFAEAQWRRALELRDRSRESDPDGLTAVLDHLADLYETAGRWRELEPIDRRILGLRLAALGPDHPETAEKRLNLALTLYRNGRYAAAEPFLFQAIRTLEEAGPPQALELAYALNYLAENLRAESRYSEAEPLFQRSLRVGEAAAGANSTELIHLLRNSSGFYRDTQRYSEAQRLTERAFAIAESAAEPGRPLLAGLLNNLAELRRFQGDLPGAETFYLKAIAVARESLAADHPRLGTFLSQLAVLYSEQGRFEEAKAVFHDALAIKEKVLGADHSDVAYTLNDLGLLYSAAGDAGSAELALAKALAVREQRLGPAHPEVALSLLALAELLDAQPGRQPEARSLLERAVSILEASPAEPRSLVRARVLRASILRRDGRVEQAKEELARGLELLETLRPDVGGGEQTRARFVSTYLAAFHRMVKWQLEDARVDEAFRFAEKARSRALLDQLAAGRVNLRSGIEPEERERLERRESELGGRLAEIRERLRVLSELDADVSENHLETARLESEQRAVASDFAHLYEQIKNASRFWRGRAGRTGDVTLPAVQGRLRPGRELMLAYVIGDQESHVFVVPPKGRRAWALPLLIPPDAASTLDVPPGPLTRTALSRIVGGEERAVRRGLIERLAIPPSGSLQRTGATRRLFDLWRILIPGDLWTQIRRCKQVVVVPDDRLHQLPFEALVIAMTRGGTVYWLDRGPALRYAASAAALLQLEDPPDNRPPPQARRLVTVSDPVYDPAEVARLLGRDAPLGSRSRSAALERLPGTAEESKSIKTAFAALNPLREVVSLTGVDANEPAVRAELQRSQYVHIATHGLVDEADGDLFATLALTPPASDPVLQQDGQLELHEIYDLGLRADLVVLSTCESRVGSVVAGEGVFALSRGFLAAGARRVVASLWPAADEATAELMGGFFRAIADAERHGQEPDFASALMRAKRAIRERRGWTDPFFWAPFVLEGAR
jgi:CHAT domain-containing protein/tetratricopeptide (TPR) repeat protein